jgi:hypothetical protein
MHNKLLDELSKAMKSNPDLNVLETIEYVLSNYSKFRKICYNPLMNNKEVIEHIEYRPGNSDIIRALERFNNRK